MARKKQPKRTRKNRRDGKLALLLLLLLLFGGTFALLASGKKDDVALPCDPVCAPGEFCVNANCVQCRNQADCAPGEVCVNGVCQPIPPECAIDADCAPGEVCVNGQCLPPQGECQGDADCVPGEQCVNNACVPIVGCRNDLDCPPETPRCVNGNCEQCIQDGDCLIGQHCENNLCVENLAHGDLVCPAQVNFIDDNFADIVISVRNDGIFAGDLDVVLQNNIRAEIQVRRINLAPAAQQQVTFRVARGTFYFVGVFHFNQGIRAGQPDEFCPQIDVPNPDTHFECQNGRCVSVPGAGADRCNRDDQCYCMQCRNGVCEQLNNPGCVGNCFANDECRHNICNNGNCIEDLTPGDDQCNAGADCRHKECQANNCVIVNTPGNDTCAIDCDCMPQVPVGQVDGNMIVTCAGDEVRLCVNVRNIGCRNGRFRARIIDANNNGRLDGAWQQINVGQIVNLCVNTADSGAVDVFDLGGRAYLEIWEEARGYQDETPPAALLDWSSGNAGDFRTRVVGDEVFIDVTVRNNSLCSQNFRARLFTPFGESVDDEPDLCGAIAGNNSRIFTVTSNWSLYDVNDFVAGGERYALIKVENCSTRESRPAAFWKINF